MDCHLVALDKIPGVHPVGIRDTLHQALLKLLMRASGEQAKTMCRNIYLYVGLKAGIEGAIHAVGQTQKEITAQRRGEDESGKDGEDENSK